MLFYMDIQTNNIIAITLIIIFLICMIYLIRFIVESFKNDCINSNNNVIFSDIKTNCLYNRYGCCNDKLTPKLDPWGSNCRGF